MKRGIFISIALTLIFIMPLIPQASALEIKTDKTQFAQGETFFATLDGNILEDIISENVGFYKNHIQIPLTFDIAKLNKTYYIYALLPYNEQNYTLKIKDVYYKEANKIQTSDLEKTFQITNKTADFNVKPGFVITDKNFTLSLYNNLNSDLEITYVIENKSHSANLPLQETTKLTVLTDDILSQGFMFMQISSDNLAYKIPLYLIKPATNVSEDNETDDNETDIDENETIINKEKLRFLDNRFYATLNKDQSISHKFYIENLGELNATNVNLILSPELKNYVSVSPNKFDLIKSNREITSNREVVSNREVSFNLTFKFTRTGNFTGFLFANSTNSSDKLWLEFRVGTNVTFNSSIKDEKNCSELKGKKCAICYGTSIVAEDGLCCMNCEPPAKSKTNWTAIYIVVGLLILILAFVLLKFKKPKLSAEDILKKKSKSFSDRFETKGSLSRE